jgi:hypothetical protein
MENLKFISTQKWLSLGALALFASACGVRMNDYYKGSSEKPLEQGLSVAPTKIFLNSDGTQVSKLEGAYLNLSNAQVSLADDRDQASIVIFATENCPTCVAEVEELRSHLGGKAPSQVTMHSILVGSDIAGASAWATAHGVTWNVGIDASESLYDAYCPQGKVPCIVVHRPQGGVVYQGIGHVSVSELEGFAGTSLLSSSVVTSVVQPAQSSQGPKNVADGTGCDVRGATKCAPVFSDSKSLDVDSKFEDDLDSLTSDVAE